MPELTCKGQTEPRRRTRNEPVLRPCGKKRLKFGEEIDTVLLLKERCIQVAMLDLIADLAVHAVLVRLLAHELERLRTLLHHLLIRCERTVVAPHHLTDEAARSRAKCENVVAALGERVVDAALAVVRCPMRRVDASCHRILCNNLKSALEILRLFLRGWEHRQITRIDAACELAAREDVELVEVAARNTELELRTHVVLPDLHRLIGQPIDEVCNDDRALLLHHAAQRLNHRIAVIDAPD